MAEIDPLAAVLWVLIIVVAIMGYFATRKSRALVASGDPFSEWKALALKLGLTLELRENPFPRLRLGFSEADKIPCLTGVFNGRQVEAGVMPIHYRGGRGSYYYAWAPCQTRGLSVFVMNEGAGSQLLQKIGVMSDIKLRDAEFDEKYQVRSKSPPKAMAILDSDARRTLVGLVKKVFPIMISVGSPEEWWPVFDKDLRKTLFSRGGCVYIETPLTERFDRYNLDEEGLEGMIEAAVLLANRAEKV